MGALWGGARDRCHLELCCRGDGGGHSWPGVQLWLVSVPVWCLCSIIMACELCDIIILVFHELTYVFWLMCVGTKLTETVYIMTVRWFWMALGTAIPTLKKTAGWVIDFIAFELTGFYTWCMLHTAHFYPAYVQQNVMTSKINLY